MKKYDISVVICVADDKRIINMLESIEYGCEVVVVLNGATSEVREMVRLYEESDIFELKIIEIEERNLSKARNVGTVNAKYDKVIFYDSDCIMFKEALPKYDKFLDKYLLVDGVVFFRKDTFSSNIISV